MEESLRHKELKQKAREILLKKGFKEKEIFEEYKIGLGKRTYYRIDVVGVNKEYSVAIECGGVLRKDKKKSLNRIFNEFIQLDYKSQGYIKTPAIEIPTKLFESLRILGSGKGLTPKDYIICLIKKEVKALRDI